MNTNQPSLTFEIIQNLGMLSESGSWKKEGNIVRWGDNIAKYDIRAWSADHARLGKGVTLTVEELRALKELLNRIDL